MTEQAASVGVVVNDSGQGKASRIPPELNRWNWGAFGLNWIWGLGNSTYIALLTLVPGVNIVMIFVLGAKGSAWAWQNDRWESIEHFKRVQRKWTIAWLIVLGISVVLCILWFSLVLLVLNADRLQPGLLH